MESAGIIPFRVREDNEVEFFVGHPGGYHKNYWAFLKGGVEMGETQVDAAIREFKEESGLTLDDCASQMLIPLGQVNQNQRKVAIAYGLHYPNINPSECYSNMCDNLCVPEIDAYRWMTYDELKECTHPTHLIFYEKLIQMVHGV